MNLHMHLTHHRRLVKVSTIVIAASVVLAVVAFGIASYTSCLKVAARANNLDVDCMLQPTPVSTAFYALGEILVLTAVISAGLALTGLLMNRWPHAWHKIFAGAIIGIPAAILTATYLDKLMYIIPFNNWNTTEVAVNYVLAVVVFLVLPALALVGLTVACATLALTLLSRDQ